MDGDEARKNGGGLGRGGAGRETNGEGNSDVLLLYILTLLEMEVEPAEIRLERG